MSAEPVDAEVVEEVEAQPVDVPQAQPVGVALARRERRHEVVRPLDVDQLAESFAAYQTLIGRLLAPEDYQGTGSERFKKKSAWRKLATAFDLDVELLTEEVTRDDAGRPVLVKAVARAISPSGRVMDGDGYCSIDEARFSTDRGRQKLEHDLRSTATTRAKNRAISDLIGAGEISAEEVSASGPSQAPAGPPLGPAAAAEEVGLARRAIGYLIGLKPGDAQIGAIADGCLVFGEVDGVPYAPKAVVNSTIALGKALAAQRKADGRKAEDDAAHEHPLAEETPEEREQREHGERLAGETFGDAA